MSNTAAARVPTRPIVRPAGRERPQPRLRVVAPAPRRSAGGLALLSLGLLVLGLLVLLLLNISIGKGAYALTELQTQQRQLAEDRQSLTEQVEAAGAPGELSKKASKLGMVPNPNTVFVQVPDGTVHGKPVVAQPPAKPLVKTRKTAKRSVGALTAVAAAGQRAVAEQKQAKQKAAKQKAAEQKAAEQKKADQKTQAPVVEPVP